MKRAKFFIFVIFIILSASLPAQAVISTDDLLYKPSAEFLDDFFLSLASGNYTYPTGDATIVLRRLFTLSESVKKSDYVSAWQTLVNLPDNPDYPVISDIRRDALAVQSITPWFSDRELKNNFLRAYDEIWLKYDGVNDDYEKFKEVFGGFASRKDSDNPASYIRDHIGYYGYTKSESQPKEDIRFIWTLFRHFSDYASSSQKAGLNYTTSDPGEYTKTLVNRIAGMVDKSWQSALIKEKIRRGEDVSLLDETGTIPQVVNEEVEKTGAPVEEKLDFSKMNVFKVPEGQESQWETLNVFEEEETETELKGHVFTPPDEKEDEINIPNPMENGEGIEPPEDVIIKNDDVIQIPSINLEDEKIEEKPVAVEEIPVPVENEKTGIAEPQEEKPVEQPQAVEKTTEEEIPVESVFISPNVTVIESEKDHPETETTESKVVDIPKAVNTEREVVPEPAGKKLKAEAKKSKAEVKKPGKEVKKQKKEEVKKPKEEAKKPKEEIKETSEAVNLLDISKLPTEEKSSAVKEVKEINPPAVEPAAETVKETTPPAEEPATKTEEKETTPPVESKPVVEDVKESTAPVQPPPVTEEVKESTPPEEQPVEAVEIQPETLKNEETVKLANELTDKTLKVAEELGKYAIDLVLLWSQDPEQVKDYTKRESDLETSFKVRKEEFLALLFVNDAFRLEQDIGISFDALNGKIIDSLMKGFNDFKESGGLKEYPDIDEAKLLSAISQLTQGVEARRDSLKIQNASLKAFRLRRSQYEKPIKRLEELKKIEIPK